MTYLNRMETGFTCESCQLTSTSPAVIILKTLDIVFAEIISALHFYKDQIGVARILYAVSCADRDVDRFTGMNGNLFTVERDLRGSFYYDPVFGTLRMFLITESLTW